MKNVIAFVRHNPGVCLGFLFIPFVLVYAYSCQSVVVSGVHPLRKINRQELVDEVEMFLASAASKFDDLDRQDMVKDTIFNSVFDLAQGKAVSPLGIASVIGGLLGLGAVGDNIKKRTHINTLKGGNVNGKVKAKIEKNSQN